MPNLTILKYKLFHNCIKLFSLGISFTICISKSLFCGLCVCMCYNLSFFSVAYVLKEVRQFIIFKSINIFILHMYFVIINLLSCYKYSLLIFYNNLLRNKSHSYGLLLHQHKFNVKNHSKVYFQNPLKYL